MERATSRGVWVAMPTPWDSRYGIGAGAVRELVQRYAAAGLHGAYTTGTDGEMHVLDLPEFTALAEGGLPAQLGCTWSHSEGVIVRARIAQANGIDTIQVALPSWVPLNDAGLRGCFAALQEELPDTRHPARARLVHEEALGDALREGWIAVAALDAQFREPLPPDDPTWAFPNAILTPYIAGSTLSPRWEVRLWDLVAQNVARFRSGEPLLA